MTLRNQRLGSGGRGPWFVATGRALSRARGAPPESFRARVVAGYYNRSLIVQIAQHPEHPGVDHLVVRHVVEMQEVKLPWSDLQLVKALAADGAERFAFELFPPAELVVDECPLRHLWVMPLGWRPPGDLGIHPSQEGCVPV